MNNIKNTIKWAANMKECEICMEYKYLKPFCGKHSFCHSCCKQWVEHNMFCPICRDKCINKKYLVYDYDVKNCDYYYFKENYEHYFQLWHKKTCIKNKHKFFVTVDQNHILFYCRDCHIEQLWVEEL